MKLSDDACDIGDDKSLAIALGILCAITSAFATVSSASAACIFIGILIGNLLALKVDGFHHIITLILFVLISLIMGIPELNLVILLPRIIPVSLLPRRQRWITILSHMRN